MPTTVSRNELDQLGECIAIYRERTGATVTQIAKEANVKRGMVSQILAGTYPSSPSMDAVKRICSVIGARVTIELDD